MNKDKKLQLLEEKKILLQKLKKQKDDYEKEIRIFEEENKILFFGHKGKEYLGRLGTWGPNALQSQLIPQFRDGDKDIFAYIGPNQIGKTFMAINVIFLIAQGCWPWEDVKKVGTWFWDLRKWIPPISIRLVGGDWEKVIKTSIIPKIREMLPKSWDVETRKNSTGVEAYWIFNFSHGQATLDIMSNRSDTEAFESWTGHAVIYDEPPDEDHRTACIRGLIANVGIEFYSMTLVNQPWIEEKIFDKIDKYGNKLPNLALVRAKTLKVNLGFGLTEKGIKNFEDSLSEKDKAIRAEGKSINEMTRVIYAFDYDVHAINPFKIPKDWPVDVAIDIGLSKANDLTFIATDTNGIKYVFHAEQIYGYGNEIGNRIIELWKEYGFRMNSILIDPLAKHGQPGFETVFEVIDDLLSNYGFELTNTEKMKLHKDIGIKKINDALAPVGGISTLYFFKTSERIFQIRKWLKDENGKPMKGQKAEDDQGENLYRLMLKDTEYEPMYIQENIEEFKIEEQKQNTRNTVTGY